LSNSEKLNLLYRPQERNDRVSLVAREFSRRISHIKKTERPNSTREEIIDEYGPIEIFNGVKETFKAYSEMEEYFTEYQREGFKKIVDNFDLLAEETVPLLVKYEEILITPNSNVTTKAVERDGGIDEDEQSD